MRPAFVALLAAALIAAAVGAATPSGQAHPVHPRHGSLPSPSPYPSPSPRQSLTPDDIFHKAQQAAANNPNPPYITYQMHEVFVHHSHRFEYDYRVWYRADGKGLMQNLTRTRRGAATETYFGYPFPFSPNTNIMLNATPPPPPSPPPPPVGGSPIPGTPPPLLSVQAVESDRYYDVRLVGIENYEGHQVYHLGLTPVRDEVHHPWKDLWIDRATFEVWKAHASASGHRGPGAGSVQGDATFSPVGGYWLVTNASGDGQIHIGFISDSGHYEYAFYDFGFPDNVPDWFFDEKQFKRHIH